MATETEIRSSLQECIRIFEAVLKDQDERAAELIEQAMESPLFVSSLLTYGVSMLHSLMTLRGMTVDAAIASLAEDLIVA